MDLYRELLTRLRNPEVQRTIVPDYDGFYSLGVARDPAGPDGIGITVSVPPGTQVSAPESITVAGLDVPIRVVEDRVAISPFK